MSAQTDLGLEVVEYVYQMMQVDRQWAVRHPRGFTWWGGALAQHVWADPPFDALGIRIWRVHARTDLLRGFRAEGEPLQRLGVLMGHALYSGPALDPAEPTLLQWASSVYVHAAVFKSIRTLMASAVALQAAEAHAMYADLADLVNASPADSAHPQSGPRVEPDGMLDVIENLIVPAGRERSRYAGQELLEVQDFLQESLEDVHIEADESSLTALFDGDGLPVFLRIFTEEVHPRAGAGALLLLTVPQLVPGEDPATVAFERNNRELRSETRSHFLGSWCRDPGGGGLTFNTFLPNFLYARGGLEQFVQSTFGRAYWAVWQEFGLGEHPGEE